MLLSCSRGGKEGRCFNIYTYENKKYNSGSWATPVASETEDGGTATLNYNTNGEILLVPA